MRQCGAFPSIIRAVQCSMADLCRRARAMHPVRRSQIRLGFKPDGRNRDPCGRYSVVSGRGSDGLYPLRAGVMGIAAGCRSDWRERNRGAGFRSAIRPCRRPPWGTGLTGCSCGPTCPDGPKKRLFRRFLDRNLAFGGVVVVHMVNLERVSQGTSGVRSFHGGMACVKDRGSRLVEGGIGQFAEAACVVP